MAFGGAFFYMLKRLLISVPGASLACGRSVSILGLRASGVSPVPSSCGRLRAFHYNQLNCFIHLGLINKHLTELTEKA